MTWPVSQVRAERPPCPAARELRPAAAARACVRRPTAWARRPATPVVRRARPEDRLATPEPTRQAHESDQKRVQAPLEYRPRHGACRSVQSVQQVKLIKRSMYGKAGFPLLRRRVLRAGVPHTPVAPQEWPESARRLSKSDLVM